MPAQPPGLSAQMGPERGPGPGGGGPRPYVTQTNIVAAHEPVGVQPTDMLFTRPLTWQHDFTAQSGMVIANNVRGRWNRGSMVRRETPLLNITPSAPPFDPTNPDTYFVKKSHYTGWDYRPFQTGLS